MTVMDRLNALDDRVMPVIVNPVRAFCSRHPVAVRRAPLVSIILLVTATALDLAVGHPDSPLLLVAMTGFVVSQLAKTRRRGSTSSSASNSG